MKTRISKGIASGTIVAPPSKSYAHRILIASFLASSQGYGEGRACRVSNVAFSDDVNATLGCLKALGAVISTDADSVLFKGTAGAGGDGELMLDCNESGSTLRFLIPMALVLNENRRIVMRGTAKLMSRGLDAYERIFERCGIEYEHGNDFFSFCGKLAGSEFVVPGNTSSQYVTGLMFALSLRQGDSRIVIEGDIESLPYIRITLDVLSGFGVRAVFSGNEIRIQGGRKYLSGDRSVEGDYSNAAFFAALNLIDPLNDVRVCGLAVDSVQGDKAYERLFPLLKENTGPEIDISDCIDLGPVLFMLASALNGAVFTGVRRLRIKESDRVACMVEELVKFGARIDAGDDSVVIHRAELHAPGSVLNGHNDHRIVMALSVLLTRFGGVIDGSEAVRKSFPDFFERLGEVGVSYEHFQG